MKKLIILFLLAFGFTFAQPNLDGSVSKIPTLWKLNGLTLSPISSTWSLSGITNITTTGTYNLSDGTDTYKLLVSSDKFTLQNDAGSPATLVTIDSLARTAIGASSTTYAFDVQSSQGASSTTTSANFKYGVTIGFYGVTNGFSGNVALAYNGGDARWLTLVNVAPQAINTGSSIEFNTNIGGTTLASGVGTSLGKIGLGKTSATQNEADGYLYFQTRTDAVALTERMRITGAGDINIGVTTAVDTQSPDLIITGDADSDGTATTTEALTIALTSNATPTLATWGFSSTQGAGYTFDKAIAGTSLALGGATIGSNALAVTGTSNLSGIVTVGSEIYFSSANFIVGASGSDLKVVNNSSGITKFNNGTSAPAALWQYSKNAAGTNDRYTSVGWGSGADSLKYSIAQTYNGGSVQGSFNATGFSSYAFDGAMTGSSLALGGATIGDASLALKSKEGNIFPFAVYSSDGQYLLTLEQTATGGAGRFDVYDAGGLSKIALHGTNNSWINSGYDFLIGTITDAGDYKLQVTGNVYSSGNVNIGATTAVDTQSPDLVITGDADSDGTAVTTEALTIALTSNATPTLATWGFTSTQGSGYTFDKTVSTTGGIIVGTNGGEIDSAKVVDGNLDAFVGGVAYSALQTAYGDAYIVGTSPQTIPIATDSVYYTVKTWTSGGVLKNVTAQDSSLTATVAGVYSIEYNIAFSTTNFSAGNTLRGYIFVDDVQQDKTGFRRYVSGTNDTGSASGQGIISLTANQVVKLKIEGLDDGDDGEAIIHNANLKLVRID